jgi:stress response protein YsnF
MALYKIKDFDPDYNSHSNDPDIKGLSMYAGTEKIGSINDILVDEEGKFRYLVVDSGGWIMGKKVLLPIGQARIDYQGKRVYADSLTKTQVEALPEFTDDLLMDYDKEEQVRGVYRSAMPKMQNAPAANGVGYAGAASAPVTNNTEPMLDLEVGYAGYDRDTYGYEKEPEMYDLNEQNHPNLKLYEERLIASKNRQKTGEAVISKRIETETANASVAVEKERVIVERIPVNSGSVVTPGEANFQA